MPSSNFRQNGSVLILRGHGTWTLILAIYAALLVGGSLYPFRPWSPPHYPHLGFLCAPLPATLTRTDIITNFLIYTPFGLFFAKAFFHERLSLMRLLLVCMIGFVFSTSMEYLQTLFRYRVASNVDVVFNSLGAMVGALAFQLFAHDSTAINQLVAFRRHWLREGWLVPVGLLLVSLWAISQFSLQTPSLIAGSLKAGFKPFWETPQTEELDWLSVWIFAVEVASVVLFAAALLQPRKYSSLTIGSIAIGAILLKFLAAAFLVKLPIFPRLLSREILFGLTGGLMLLLLVLQRHKNAAPLHYVAMFLGALALAKLFRGLPFVTASGMTPDLANQPEVLLNITGIAYLIAVLWPYLALGCILGWMGKTKPD